MKLTNFNFTNISVDEIMRLLSIFQDQSKTILNSGIIFSDNFNSKIIDVSFAAANTDTKIDHNLNRVPTGYLLLKTSAPLSIYDGTIAATANTIFLRSSAIGNTSVMVF